jgi:protein-tyrosine phosphatase
VIDAALMAARPTLSSRASEGKSGSGMSLSSSSVSSSSSSVSSSSSSSSSLAERRARFSLAPSLSVDYNCSKILPHVYLGGQEMACEAAMLRSLNVTHVLSVTVDKHDHFPGEFAYAHVEMLDSPEADLLGALEPAFAFIDAAKAGGHACLVHCNYGMSRSPSVVIAYLMRSDEGLSLAGALRMVKQMRPVVAPNHGFMAQLLAYEQDLRGATSIDIERYRADRTADPSEYSIDTR